MLPSSAREEYVPPDASWPEPSCSTTQPEQADPRKMLDALAFKAPTMGESLRVSTALQVLSILSGVGRTSVPNHYAELSLAASDVLTTYLKARG